MISRDAGFTHISSILGDVEKEILRRIELRPRLEAELGHPLDDQEFIEIADQTGVKL